MDTRSGRFPLVDSLRAVAALAVLFHHVGGFGGAFTVPGLDWYALQFQAGVALFFCISGFLLYRPFVGARIAGRSLPHVGAYAWRRFLRIFPAYWVVLTALALTITPEVFDQPLLYYGLVQVYDPAHVLDGLDVAWTLCIEVAFYALLPVYALLMRRLPARTRDGRYAWEIAGLLALAVAGIGFRAWGLDGNETSFGATLFTLPAFLDWFALGMGLALVSVWLEDRRDGVLPGPLAWLDGRPGIAWVAAFAAFTVAAWAADDLDGARQNMALHLSYGLTGFFLLVPGVIGDRTQGMLRGVLALPVLAWLGLVSYGIYLWQRPVIQWIADLDVLEPTWFDPNPLWIPLALVLTVAAAALSYYLVERPVLKLKRLVSPAGVRPDQPGAVSAPPLPESR